MERRKNKQPKLNIRKNDQVVVIAGDDKGKKGRIIEVIPSERRVMVEGVNIVKKHVKPNTNRDYPNGGIVEKELPIHISNVMILEGNVGVRVGRKVNEEGKLERFSKKSGVIIK